MVSATNWKKSFLYLLFATYFSENTKIMRNFLWLLALPFIWACQAPLNQVVSTANLSFEGDMLFEGPNTLSTENTIMLSNLAEENGLETSQIASIGVSSAVLKIAESGLPITESLLLQITSNNHELITLGTLSPLPADQKSFKLELAEEIDLLPYFEDEGCTWVLDFNLNSEHMDTYQAKAKIDLTLNYEEK